MNENVVFMVVLSFLFLRQKKPIPRVGLFLASEAFITERSFPARKKQRGNVTTSSRGGMFLYSSSDCQQALAHTCLQAGGGWPSTFSSLTFGRSCFSVSLSACPTALQATAPRYSPPVKSQNCRICASGGSARLGRLVFLHGAFF